MSYDPDREKHLKGASDSTSRINDARCVFLATWGISKARYAIIDALDAISGGRLEWFPCFLDPLARRLNWDSPSTLQVQREIRSLLEEQRKAGLEISNKGGRGHQIHVEGHIISYISSKRKGVAGEFQLNIKRYALLAYDESRNTPGYREHKSGTVEEIAHRRGKELLSSVAGGDKEIPESVYQVFDKSQGGAGEKDYEKGQNMSLSRDNPSSFSEETLSGEARVHAPSPQAKGELIGGKLVYSASPDIVSAVAAQIEGLVSIGVVRFSLRIVHIIGKARDQRRAVQCWNDLTPERMLELAPLVVQRCRDMVENKDREWNAILTPYTRQGVQLLQADDIGEELLERLNGLDFQRYRTSDGDGLGNYQALIAVRSTDNTLPYRFKKTVGSDMGASLSVRIAGSYNAKPWRRRADGSYAIFTLIDDNLGLIIDEQKLIEAGFVSELTKKRAAEDQVSETNRKKPLPEYSYFLQRAEPRNDGSGNDISRVDYNAVKCIAERGYSFGTALRFLEKYSLIERRDRDGYFRRTVEAAFEDAGRSESAPIDGTSEECEYTPTQEAEPIDRRILTDTKIHEVPRTISNEAAKRGQSVTGISRHTIKCDHCEAKISIGDPFCAECGAHMVWGQDDELAALG